MTTTTEKRFTPEAGTFVKPDGWEFGSILEDSNDGFSTFRLPTHSGGPATMYGGPVTSLAAEIEVTGRNIRLYRGMTAVRVRITFPGDGEPDTVTSGWMRV